MNRPMKYAVRHERPKTSMQLANDTIDRLGVPDYDAAFFTTVFTFVRDEEMAGRDTYPLWLRYRSDESADLATAAYLEGIASTRKMARLAL